MEILLNKKSRWLSWYIHWKWYAFNSRCVSKFSKEMFWNTWTSSCSPFLSSRISMADFFEKDWNRIRIISLYWYAADIRKRIQAEYVMQFIDMQRQIMNIGTAVTKLNNHHI